MKSIVSLVSCDSYNAPRVQEAVRRSIDLLGGIVNFIKPSSSVLVKPNILMAIEPERGITTHPEVVRAVIRLLKEIDCQVYVGDSPSVFGKYIENVEEVYRRSGISAVCVEEKVELVSFNKRVMKSGFPLTNWLNECAFFVNVPKFKTHDLTLLTGAVKNLFGLVSGTYKTELHKKYFKPEGFSRMLVDLFELARPSLTVVDGIVSLEGDGPGTSGRIRNTGFLIAGVDCVAIDSILSLIMGIKPQDVFTTREASCRGLGQADVDLITILGERLQDFIKQPFLLPSTSLLRKKIPQPIAKLAQRMIKYRPYVKFDKCLRCLACVKACPETCIILRDKRIVFDYSQCIACFCCQEVCPVSAIKVKKSLFARLIGL